MFDAWWKLASTLHLAGPWSLDQILPVSVGNIMIWRITFVATILSWIPFMLFYLRNITYLSEHLISWLFLLFHKYHPTIINRHLSSTRSMHNSQLMCTSWIWRDWNHLQPCTLLHYLTLVLSSPTLHLQPWISMWRENQILYQE